MVMLDAFAPVGAERFQKSLRRAGGLALVLILHAITLFLLATSTAIRTAVPAFIAHETELILLPKPRPKKAVRVLMPGTRTRALHEPPSFILPPATPNMSGVGHSLFGCLGQIDCTNAPLSIPPGAMEGSPLAPHTLVLYEAHWEGELAHERTPVRVPCTGFKQIVSGAEEMTALMVDPLCIINRMYGLNLGKM
jgi:hypothetical protein